MYKKIETSYKHDLHPDTWALNILESRVKQYDKSNGQSYSEVNDRIEVLKEELVKQEALKTKKKIE